MMRRRRKPAASNNARNASTVRSRPPVHTIMLMSARYASKDSAARVAVPDGFQDQRSMQRCGLRTLLDPVTEREHDQGEQGHERGRPGEPGADHDAEPGREP